ncbi:MAG: serine protease HtrA, partial [Roseburia sp.]|nr:serine protease HtrA [Roseburia sp.]
MDQNNFNYQEQFSDSIHSYNQPQNGGYYGNGNGGYQQNGNPEPKKENKSGGFGMKLAKCAAYAVVFGLVAGVVFEGVHLTSNAMFGTKTIVEERNENVVTQSDGGKVQTTKISNTY